MTNLDKQMFHSFRAMNYRFQALTQEGEAPAFSCQETVAEYVTYLERVIEDVRAWNRLTNGNARYRELDRIVNEEEWIDA